MRIAAVALALTLAQFPAPQIPEAPDCKALLSGTPPPGVAQLCDAEASVGRATALPTPSPDRTALLQAAVEQYARAVQVLQDTQLRIHAYERLFLLHDAAHLNEPVAAENALRQLATLVAGTPAPLIRLAAFQEQHGRPDAAEQTLIGARQQYPDSLAVLRELSTFYARFVLAVTSTGPAGVATATPPPPKPIEPGTLPDCKEFSFGDAFSPLAQLCVAEAEMRKAAAARKGAADATERARLAAARTESLRAAAKAYAAAAEALKDVRLTSYAYEALARVYGAANLNQPRDAEAAVRELIALAPNSTAPLIRLASLQEEQKLADAAEGTLLMARQQFPEDLELLKALSRFYARLATTAATTEARREREKETPPVAGQPDANGFYGIGGHIPPPERDRHVAPVYPPEAKAIDLEGIVILEIFISETGEVTNARAVRGIPMLEEAAIAAAKQWRFQPTVIDGRPVPARMTVTVPFPQPPINK